MVSKKALKHSINGLGRRVEVLEHVAERGKRVQLASFRRGIAEIHAEISRGASNVVKIARVFDALMVVEENCQTELGQGDQLIMGKLIGKAAGTISVTGRDVNTALAVLARYDPIEARRLRKQLR